MKHKRYTKEELEQFCEDNFLEKDTLPGLHSLATRCEVKLTVKEPTKPHHSQGELIIKVKLVET